MLDALRTLAEREPIDVVLLWLGANDCLQTVLELEIAEMPASYSNRDPFDRLRFNLTSVEQFRRDYTELVETLEAILERATGLRQVYVATVPHVTIPPIIRGLGDFDGHYFEHYVRFFHQGEPRLGRSLTRAQMRRIDARIDDYNRIIRELVEPRGWTIVDTAGVLDELAIHRNGHESDPCRALVEYQQRRDRPDHPLLSLDPIPCASAFRIEADAKGHRRVCGGIFGLDYVHPTTIAYGIVAEAFLDAIKARNSDNPHIAAAAIDWSAVIGADTLIQSPPTLWDDLMQRAEWFDWLLEVMLCVGARQIKKAMK
jgi:lysophospholipase L1-like esterase